MVDLLLKEQNCIAKTKTLRMINMLVDDELYKKEYLIRDLTNLVAFLDEMEVDLDPITVEE